MPSPNFCHNVGSTESSRISLYAVKLRFPFIGTKGPSPNHEKQSQTIIPHPPNFTVSTMHWGRQRSPGIRQTQIRPLDCQMVKLDSSPQRMHFIESNGGELYITPTNNWHCTWSYDLRLVYGCSAIETHSMKLHTNSSCADVDCCGQFGTR